MCPKTHTDTLVNSKIGGKMDVHPPRIWYHKVQLQPDFGTMQFCNSSCLNRKTDWIVYFVLQNNPWTYLCLISCNNSLERQLAPPTHIPTRSPKKHDKEKYGQNILPWWTTIFPTPTERGTFQIPGVSRWPPVWFLGGRSWGCRMPRLWISVVKKNSPRATLWMCSIWKRHTQDMAHNSQNTKFDENTNLMCSHHLNAVKMAKTEGKYM